MPTPADDELLKLYITAAEFDDQLKPLLARFPDLRWTWMDVAHQHRPEQELQHWPVILSPRLRERYPSESREQVSPLMEPLVAFLKTLAPIQGPQLVDWDSPFGALKVSLLLPHRIAVWYADELAAEETAMRQGRPTDVQYVELAVKDGKTYGKIEPASTDWAWLAKVVDDGFDPHGPLGPTYWRITESQHYSVFRQPDTGELALLISARKGDPIFGNCYAEMGEAAAAHLAQRDAPWEEGITGRFVPPVDNPPSDDY
jgi:hypothetical protein